MASTRPLFTRSGLKRSNSPSSMLYSLRMSSVKLTFYVIMFGLALIIANSVFGGEEAQLQMLTTPHMWIHAMILAVFPTVVSLLLMIIAVHDIGSTPTAILGALEPLTAVFIGVTLFGEPFTFRLACGILLIVSAVTLIIAGGSITSHLVRFRKLFPRLPFKRRHHAGA